MRDLVFEVLRASHPYQLTRTGGQIPKMNGITNCPDDVKLANDPSRAFLADYARRRVSRRVVTENGTVLPRPPREAARRHSVGSSLTVPQVVVHSVSDEEAVGKDPADAAHAARSQRASSMSRIEDGVEHSDFRSEEDQEEERAEEERKKALNRRQKSLLGIDGVKNFVSASFDVSCCCRCLLE